MTRIVVYLFFLEYVELDLVFLGWEDVVEQDVFDDTFFCFVGWGLLVAIVYFVSVYVAGECLKVVFVVMETLELLLDVSEFS